MIRLDMEHAGSRRVKMLEERHWLGKDLMTQMRVAIGAWCDNVDGHQWIGEIYEPIKLVDGEMLANLVRGNTHRSMFFIVKTPDIGGPW